MIVTCLRGAPGLLVSVLAIGLAVCGRAEAEGDAQARARALNDQGNSAYDLGNYEEAIARFSEAYRAYPDARILFNLAQSHRKRGEYQRALDLFRAYLRNLPSASNRKVTEELTAELEALMARHYAADVRPPRASTPTAPPPTIVTKIQESRPWYANTAGWWLVGGGVVAAGVGVGFFVSTQSLEDELSVAADPNKAGIRSDISTRRTVGTVCSVVGGLAVAGGVAVFLFAPRTVTREIVPIRDLRLSVGPNHVALSGRF